MVKVNFLNKEFKSQMKFEEYIKDIIYNKVGICSDIKNKYPKEYEILLELLKRHPDHKEKTKDLINLKIKRNIKNHKALELNIEKPNGYIDVSFLICIKAKKNSIKTELMSALRSSIEEQIVDFRDNNNNYCCSICNKVDRLEVDHINYFDEIVYNFIKENKYLPIPKNFDDLTDGSNRRTFMKKDLAFMYKFQYFHEENANLRMLCKKCNLSRPKSKIKLDSNLKLVC
jgi:hypothetical protein